MNCFAIGIESGLEYAEMPFRLYDSIPIPTPHETCVRICENLGLNVVQYGKVLVSKWPALIGYHLGLKLKLIELVYGQEDANAHVEFTLDASGFIHKNITLYVDGWEFLKDTWHCDPERASVLVGLTKNKRFIRCMYLKKEKKYLDLEKICLYNENEIIAVRSYYARRK